MEIKYEAEIRRVLIVGAGWVGRQIAARLVLHEIDVVLYDRQAEATQQSVDWIRRHALAEHDGSYKPSGSGCSKDLSFGKLETIDQLDVLAEQTSSGREALQLVIESAPEQLSAKRRVLSELSKIFEPPIIIASNSSYFVPSLLGQYVETPERFAHIHFHVPVLHDSIADIVGHPATNAGVIHNLRKFTERIGLDPLVLRKEQPGYVFNWMLQALLRSALDLVAKDVVDPEDVDRSWRTITGMPLGPFGMMDQIGLDVIEQVLANGKWAPDATASFDQVMQLVRDKTNNGKLGVKTGEGFYQHSDDGGLR
ncbi:MAG: 3-hydroxyacyl-CoA dehydrogenase NAD-binding domain-containing protein [Aureliella sp.]